MFTIDASSHANSNHLSEIKSVIENVVKFLNLQKVKVSSKLKLFISFIPPLKVGIVSFNKRATVELSLGEHTIAEIMKAVNAIGTEIWTSGENELVTSLNRAIITSGKLFTNTGLLMMFSDFFSTDDTFPDIHVSELARKKGTIYNY